MPYSRLLSSSDTVDPVFAAARRSNWVRLRTLVLLRWIAIAGQLLAVVVGVQIFDLRPQIGLIYLAIGAAIITNLVAIFLFPETKRLSERELAGVLAFDMVQLTSLLALTGGLHNPFSVLILAQIAIAATTLRGRATVVLGVVAVVLVTLIDWMNMPLATHDGQVLRLPAIFLFGFWSAIVVGIIFQAAYARRVTREITAMADALSATQMALAREQKLTDLGGVVAAAAHELGTPLATIAVVSGEMMDDPHLDGEQRADARLIREQAERCRVILRSMGQSGKRDELITRLPISTVVEEAAEPHQNRGIAILFDIIAEPAAEPHQPVVLRRPEIVHGIRNLVQNAVDFAKTTVWIDIRWSDTEIMLRIADDGPGYPTDLLPFLGDPFLRKRRGTEQAGERRERYEGMGLGLFIAKTLLERSGAELTFANGHPLLNIGASAGARVGALVTTTWQREDIDVPAAERNGFEENAPIAE
ncbi:two-component system sensor histidine kinase RegB [Palleronia aestuarii]|uniref:histidine kinase n=1 Tax=Palleronia aestuarii TaxID=568105 RepID=A0A2W7NHR2_9RHOB|nr:ActS/PrrB/RegB family redox-sensitive histidine kinase [Palleronia aestuarii]PZX18993.1 two-component system sensor histidine kinase RegB [Palleronia aestuarii]